MAAPYAKHFSTKRTPQSEKIPGSKQVANAGGGFAFAADDWTRLDRFLVLGSEGGSYYAGEQKLCRENAEAVLRCIAADGVRAVNAIAAVADSGRAPKHSPAVFALALAACLGGPEAKKAAFAALPGVCRTGTHLFEFVAAASGLRGWGRSLREGVANWYTSKTARDLAYQAVKYQARGGWTHSDLLRLSHAHADDPAVQAVLRWVRYGVGGMGPLEVRRKCRKGGDRVSHYPAVTEKLPDPVVAFEAAKKAASAADIVRLIEDHGLVRECVPTRFLNDPAVWEALLAFMPLHAMVRNLGKMTAVGLVKPLSAASRRVAQMLDDDEWIHKARLHPLAILTALKVYQQGHGDKGKLTWTPDDAVVNALDGAFYKAFKAVRPTGKNWLLALDVSSSMTWGQIAGSPFTPRTASAAMALVTANVERGTHFVGFADGIRPLTISPRQRLDDVVKYLDRQPFGGTDCALPMVYARREKLEVDAFVTFTDSETNTGDIHPCQALDEYRQATGRPAKLIVVGMVSGGFTIADPDDAGMLDVVGFDTAAPAVMADFVRG
jgi:60 kDa SS-A/Ro ribonucleoprotein